ncbi:HIT domain-containing protein [Candidatus Pacearchaeota archaeon CG_4_9_14_0_2_um_filter_39_13]|nr:HIT family protein [Candidatus Pacearchaeota archaeon]OIO43934.1 MAG: hypothetical protein AUJ64_01395 [Candidatus Pacearchaeota archaeon CG1_02_39_14]PJC44785.1 MAG: HIT domain-containing protein [Candidatus Pacearchaeota archaeon CG_4_9_14_0_2_um_filter_39_13]
MDCEICRFKDNHQLLETKYWSINLSEDQYYLGRCFVTLKRHCGDLADLNEKEQKDFFKIVKKLEAAIRKAFGADLFNWGCLMNNSFEKKPWNPYVHWHVRPRYAKSVRFEGEIFEDKEFGSHYKRKTGKRVTKKAMNGIINRIKLNLS